MEPADKDYGSHHYSSGQIRVAFIRSNEILNSSTSESIGGNRLFGGVVLTTEEKFRDTWLKVDTFCI